MKYLYIVIYSALVACSSGCSRQPENVNNPGDSSEVTIPGDHEEDESVNYEGIFNDPDIRLLTLKKQPFAFILRTGGQIMVDSRDIVVISAKTSGIIMFADHFLFPGVRTIKGQTLFTIPGGQMADNNTELRFRQISADLDKATADFERAKKLISEKIITEERYLSAKNEYEKLLLEYNNLSSTFTTGGNIVTVPENGYIKEIFVTEGQKVSSGDPLASIVLQHNIVLKADIPPDNINIINSFESANFTVGYSSKLFRTDEMNGRVISSGKSTGGNSFYIPIFFRIDLDPELIEGTFAEVYLMGKEISNAIVVPNTALMEEFGKIYVFVQHEDGDFIKRYISKGNSDGENTQVLTGLQENETIVASGASHVRLSMMTSTPGSHNH